MRQQVTPGLPAFNDGAEPNRQPPDSEEILQASAS
jgi:hypothetical protein